MLSTVGSDRSCRTYNSKTMKLVLIGIRNELLILFTFAVEQDLQVHVEHGGTWEEQVGWEEKES